MSIYNFYFIPIHVYVCHMHLYSMDYLRQHFHKNSGNFRHLQIWFFCYPQNNWILYAILIIRLIRYRSSATTVSSLLFLNLNFYPSTFGFFRETHFDHGIFQGHWIRIKIFLDHRFWSGSVLIFFFFLNRARSGLFSRVNI